MQFYLEIFILGGIILVLFLLYYLYRLDKNLTQYLTQYNKHLLEPQKDTKQSNNDSK